MVFNKTGSRLDKAQTIILRNLWEDERQTYDAIARGRGYSGAHLKSVGAELWNLLTEVLGEKVTKSTFQTVVQGFWKTQQRKKSALSNPVISDAPLPDLDSNFVGRDREIAELQTLN